MKEGERPGGIIRMSAVGMVRILAAVFFEELGEMSSNQQNISLRPETDL